MAEGTQVIGGASGALGGAAEGAIVGSVIPVIGTAAGAIIGGILGAASGFLSSGSNRASFRSQRQAEFFRNQSLKLQAINQTRAGGKFQSGQRVAAAGAGLKGASITQLQLQALIDVNRARSATLAGISSEFQSGGGRVTPADERASAASLESQRQARGTNSPRQTTQERLGLL